MDFTYESYEGRLILNPNDFIIRFENKENGRMYERTFFENDFTDYTAFGGIHFIQKTLSLALQEETTPEMSTELIEDSVQQITFKLKYNAPVFLKPLEFSFQIFAQRKQNASIDVDGLDKKLKDLTKIVEKTFTQMSVLQKKVSDLEERCGDTIVLPGCDYAIPTDITSLTLIRNGTELFENNTAYLYSNYLAGHRIKSIHNQNGNYMFINPLVPSQGPWSGNAASHTTWEAVNNSFVFHNLISINNIKFLKNIKTLLISGCNSITDFSVLSELTGLISISIVCSLKTTSAANPPIMGSTGHNPQIKDISWIKTLKKLEHVSFRGCSQLIDITPLKNLPNLKTLDIRETGVKNTDFLTHSGLTITK